MMIKNRSQSLLPSLLVGLLLMFILSILFCLSLSSSSSSSFSSFSSSSSSSVFVQAQITTEKVYTATECAVLRATSIGNLPCQCRENTGNVVAVACYPNCCPKTASFEGDRCHTENQLDWSPYEQSVCIPAPPTEYLDDTPNCFDKGNNPIVRSATASGGTTTINFELSLMADHQCDDLFVAHCNVTHRRTGFGIFNSFRVNTTADTPAKHCWLPCAPQPIIPCTNVSCPVNRGLTPGVVRDWTMNTQLAPHDYVLVCKTLMTTTLQSTLYQFAFASSYFKIV